MGAYPVNAVDEKIINGQVDNNSIKMVQGQLSNAQSINIKENPGIDLLGNASNPNIGNNSNITNSANSIYINIQNRVFEQLLPGNSLFLFVLKHSNDYLLRDRGDRGVLRQLITFFIN